MSPLLRAWVSTSALYLSGLWLPVGGVLLMLFTPQPGLRLERSLGTSGLLALVALVTATAALAGGAVAAAFYLAGFALLTLLLPAVLRRGWSIENTVGAVALALGAAITLAALGLLDGPSEAPAALRTMLEDARGTVLEVYRHSGVAADRYEDLEAATALVVRGVVRLAPALLLIGIGVTVLLNLMVVRWQQRRAGAVPVFGDLTRWSAPPWLVWVLIASGYGVAALPEGGLHALALNVAAGVLAVYFLQGLAIVEFWLARWSSPTWVRLLCWAIVLVEWLFAAGVCLIGVFDLWADFRRLVPRPDDEDE